MWWTLKCDKICKNVKSAKNIYKVKKQLIYANLENFYTFENDLGEIETSWFFIANIYLKKDGKIIEKGHRMRKFC